MKKYALGFAAVMSLIFATVGFAENTVNKTNKESGYYSSLHPLMNETKTAAVKGANLFPSLTDITVINASLSPIYVIVPGTPIDDMLYPNSSPDHIRNNSGAFYTDIVIEDPYSQIFFDETVCERALIIIYGTPNAYNVNVDNEYCNYSLKLHK